MPEYIGFIGEFDLIDEGTILDKTKTEFVIDDSNGVQPLTYKINLAQIETVIGGGGGTGSGITFVQTTLPSVGSAPGLYSVQTGSARGLYISTGNGAVILITEYPEDGDWPVV